MSFRLRSYQGEAQDLNLDSDVSAGHDREERVLGAIRDSLATIADEIGGYVAVSCSGHVNEAENQPGDVITINVGSIVRPNGPTPDAGAGAALGSTAISPPEATTAAPVTADGSPPAAQGPIPQPAGTPVETPTQQATAAPVATDTAQAVIGNPTEDAQQGQINYANPLTPADVVAGNTGTADQNVASAPDAESPSPAPSDSSPEVAPSPDAAPASVDTTGASGDAPGAPAADQSAAGDITGAPADVTPADAPVAGADPTVADVTVPDQPVPADTGSPVTPDAVTPAPDAAPAPDALTGIQTTVTDAGTVQPDVSATADSSLENPPGSTPISEG